MSHLRLLAALATGTALLAHPGAARADSSAGTESSGGAGSGAPKGFRSPGRFELRLSPTGPLAFGGIGGAGSGLGVLIPDGGDSIVSFGITAGLGFLVTPMFEPGVSLEVNVIDAGQSFTTVQFTPFIKLNIWLSSKANVFFEPHAGFLLLSAAGNSSSFARLGFRFGVEYLFGGRWGITFWTGFGAIVGDATLLDIPLRWGIVAYF